MHIEISKSGRTTIRKQLFMELAVYGMLTAVYTSMFFFGALYPVYGIPRQAVEKQQTEAAQEADETKETDRTNEADGTEETDRSKKADRTNKTDGTEADAEEIVYKSLLLEKLKEWF